MLALLIKIYCFLLVIQNTTAVYNVDQKHVSYLLMPQGVACFITAYISSIFLRTIKSPAEIFQLYLKGFYVKFTEKPTTQTLFYMYEMHGLILSPCDQLFHLQSLPSLILTVSQLLAFNYNTEHTCYHTAYTALSQWVIISYWHQLMCGGSCVSMHVYVWEWERVYHS